MKKMLIFSTIFLLIFGLCLAGCNIEFNHQHIVCEECGKCTDTECDGAVLDKCLGHTPKHEHVACPECGKCVDPECDGVVLGKCLGHTPKQDRKSVV